MSETKQARRQWSDIFKMLKEKSKITSKNIFQKLRRNTFSNKQKLREFIVSRSVLQKTLKEKFQAKAI